MDMERVMKHRLVFEEKMDANQQKMSNMASFHEKVDARNAELDSHYEKMISN
jgi:hypothetical protein